MSRWRHLTLAGWGRTSHVAVEAARPERLSELRAAVLEGGPLLAHGLGRSYGDNPLPPAGAKAILLHRLNRLISFDETTGELVAEAGITFAELMRIFLPRGWLVPVSPGTAFVTLGGALANNVHGKNHPSMGALSRHVQWLDLLKPDGVELRLSRTQNPQLFFATLGGIGLTGIIVRACVKLLKVPGRAMAVTQHRVKNLDEMLAAFRTQPESDPFAVAWLDALASGSALGRGIYERAHPSEHRVKPYSGKGPSLPFALPNFALNPLSIGVFNKLRYAAVGRAKPTLHFVPAEKFFYPLDSIRHWNHMYGKRGFHQFQAVIPDAAADVGIRALLTAISASRKASFLAVLKRLGGEDESLLSFAMPGFILALDFPNDPGVPELIQKLIGLTRDHGGRVYLAKDSLLRADDFAAMYPRLGEFRAALEQADPGARMASLMAQRLNLRRAA